MRNRTDAAARARLSVRHGTNWSSDIPWSSGPKHESPGLQLRGFPFCAHNSFFYRFLLYGRFVGVLHRVISTLRDSEQLLLGASSVSRQNTVAAVCASRPIQNQRLALIGNSRELNRQDEEPESDILQQ
jgi:hypothetical protein